MLVVSHVYIHPSHALCLLQLVSTQRLCSCIDVTEVTAFILHGFHNADGDDMID